MLVNLNDVLYPAQKNKYAVGLFNTVNLEMAKGVLQAAEELQTPVIIGTAEVLLPSASLEELAYFLKPMAEKASVPVVLHFDHGLTRSLVLKAMDLGFTSVMYDCSMLPLEENIREVAEIVEIAHSRGVSVEGELGHVGANELSDESHGADDLSIYTQPLEALHYAQRTQCDALAVSIGTAHGAYKSLPKLDISRLQEIAAVCKTPLVLHGGSGLRVEDFRNCIENGISKVNIFTDINCAQVNGIVKHYTPGCGMTDVTAASIAHVKEATKEKMRIFNMR